jgi:hypothetical protein
MQQFESKKKSFASAASSKRATKLELIMPELESSSRDVAGYDKRYHEIALTHEDIKGCFQPVIEKILELVNSQVSAVVREGNPRVETIILVGGLGESPYVREKLSEWCQERNIRIATPMGGG